MNWSGFIQYWGAGVATILAIIRVWEFVRDRRQLHLTYSSMDRETKIVVSSIGKNSVFVQSYFLYWRSSRWFGKRKALDLAFPEDEIINHSVSIDKPLVLIFAEQNYFSMRRSDMPNAKLYLGLIISGRRNPIILKV
jgi:hypothetical protein